MQSTSRFGGAPLLDSGTQGKELVRLRAGPFLLTETWHSAGLSLGRHAHERASVNVVLDGSIREILSTEEIACSPGSLVVKPAGSYHANRYGDQGARSLLVELDEEGLDDVPAAAHLFSDFGSISAAPIASIARRIYQELRRQDETQLLIVEGLVLQLIGTARRAFDCVDSAANPPAWLNRVRERLLDGFRPGDDLASLAAEVGVDSDTLERSYRRHYGRGVGDGLRASRLEWAAAELERSDRTVGEIALRAGFYDQSHFTHHFRRAFGMPPGRYRRACR